ncbi:hypothetical protein NP233_g4745 [Leucocoprinus birnbaumii]|uniref:Uncharacterized protein n=1 Tax=Leucocoprinus birnbaumii TaxID=56174 RepID=A0AAD5YSI7_9AGAR|nr:hypothetical protein NP233_g4745 [Leucocoprinus birnbaumii]
MPSSLFAAATAAQGGLSHTDSTTSFQRYEERVSSMPAIIPRHLDPEDAASSKISILPPLTHPRLPYTSEANNNFAPPPVPIPHHPGFSSLRRRPSAAGAEPGANPRRDSSVAKYAQYKQECIIDVVDYDAEDATIERLGNVDFINMMKAGYSKDANDELDSHPKAVRWINIGGVDWDVLSTLALRYHIHSLALEDVLHEHRNIQTKADYYPDHLFIRVLSHSVCPVEDHSPPMSPESHRKSPRKCSSRSGAPPAYGTTDIESGVPSPHTSDSTTPLLAQHEEDSSLPFLRSLELRTRFSSFNVWGLGRKDEIVKLRALTAEDRPNILHEPMFIFLFHDGTVISIMPTANLDFTAPITERLYHNQSVLRTTEDASLLLQSLLDLVVDRILEVVDEYQMKIHKIEHDIMLNPSMESVRSLHVLSGDLIMHKLTLEPIKTMMYNLRRYDVDRCVAMAKHIKAEAEFSDDDGTEPNTPAVSKPNKPASHGSAQKETDRKNGKRPKREQSLLSSHWGFEPEASRSEPDGDGDDRAPADSIHGMDMGLNKKSRKRLRARRQSQAKRDAERAERMRWEKAWRYLDINDGQGGDKRRFRGYLSYMCKVYLSDVCDHMEFALTSLDMFAGISENLIDYAFNMASYNMNQVMNRLTIVTIIFLPLTLLTGYFGMNFEPFTSLDGHSETLFWKIAIPSMAALIPLFMITDILDFGKYVARRWKSGRAAKVTHIRIYRAINLG